MNGSHMSVYPPLYPTALKAHFSRLAIWTGTPKVDSVLRAGFRLTAQKRAVSRLVEMTTSPGYQSEEWNPLHQSGRTWETKLSPSSSSSSSSSSARSYPARRPSRPIQDRPEPKGANDDLAIEAGYSRPHRLTPTPTRDMSHGHAEERMIDHPLHGATRHKPPMIKEQHVWGVAEEWGAKAGKWGEGSKAFNSGSDSKRDPGEDEGKEDK